MAKPRKKPLSKKQREAAARALEKSFVENMERFKETKRVFQPTGRELRLVCSICKRGPNDGVELFRPAKRAKDRELVCKDCKPTAKASTPKPKARLKIALAPDDLGPDEDDPRLPWDEPAAE